MVSSAAVSSKDTVLEIGPGKGALTKELLDTGATVIAIEKDDRLVPFLLDMFKKEHSLGRFVLFHGDALEFSPSKWIKGDYKLVANIPYYITGILIRTYMEGVHPPVSMTILVQKEVAERIVAKDGKESLLSLSVKLYGTPVYRGTVSKRYFSPAPKVDSAILYIKDITQDKYTPTGRIQFFELLHLAFAHKRKTILHNLNEHYPKELLKEKLRALGKSEQARAEELGITDWKFLFEKTRRE